MLLIEKVLDAPDRAAPVMVLTGESPSRRGVKLALHSADRVGGPAGLPGALARAPGRQATVGRRDRELSRGRETRRGRLATVQE